MNETFLVLRRRNTAIESWGNFSFIVSRFHDAIWINIISCLFRSVMLYIHRMTLSNIWLALRKELSWS